VQELTTVPRKEDGLVWNRAKMCCVDLNLTLYQNGMSCQHYAGKTGPHFCAARYKFRSLKNFSQPAHLATTRLKRGKEEKANDFQTT
jgi:hypothetical protein